MLTLLELLEDPVTLTIPLETTKSIFDALSFTNFYEYH